MVVAKNSPIANIILTPRDSQIALMVHRFEGCTIGQLERRFWPSGDKRYGARSAAYRRIRQLVDWEYLRVDRLPPLTGNGGSGRAFLTLGRRGRDLVAHALGIGVADLPKSRALARPYPAAHHMAVCQFQQNLELACEQSDGEVELVEWRPERLLRTPPIVKVLDPRPPKGTPRPLIPLIPDGEFTVRLASGAVGSMRAEIDLATTSAKRIQAKLRGYLAYAIKDIRPVLWLVPDERRQAALLAWAIQEARSLRADATLFWIAAQPAVDETTILGPIWRVAGGPLVGLSDVTPAIPDGVNF